MRLPDWLPTESDAWERDGLITADQRRAILARYAAPASAADQASSALTWLAVLAAGIGAIVLVAWNWTSIPDIVKILLSAGPMLGLYAASAMAARAGRDVRAERFALLAALFAGGVLFVTEDLVHIDPQRTNTTLLWAVVLAATAVLTPSALTAAVATLATLWWVLMAGDSGAGAWWFLAIWPMLALAVERAPNRWVASGVTFAFGFWVFFITLSIWADQPTAPGVAVVLAGCWLDSLARAPVGRRPAFARTTPALFVTMLGMVLLLPSGSHAAMSDWHVTAGSVWPGLALLAALALGIAANAAASGVWRSRTVAVAALAVCWVIAWLALPGSLRASWWQQWLWTWAFSAAMILMGAGAVREAARTRDLAPFALGLLCVLVFVIVRVVDAQSLVVSGLMLLASAVVLWWLGRLWARATKGEVAS